MPGNFGNFSPISAPKPGELSPVQQMQIAAAQKATADVASRPGIPDQRSILDAHGDLLNNYKIGGPSSYNSKDATLTKATAGSATATTAKAAKAAEAAQASAVEAAAAQAKGGPDVTADHIDAGQLDIKALGPDQRGLNAIRDRALSQGPSPWLNMQMDQQKLSELDARDKVSAGAMGANEAANSSLAMRGGLSGGARERGAQNLARSINSGQQATTRAGQMDRLGLNIADENTKMGLLSQLPGMDLANANFNADLNKFNIGTKLSSDTTNAANRLQAGMFNTGQANDMSRFNVGQTNDVSKFNAGNKTNVNMYNTGQTNDTRRFNVGQANDLSKYNAGLKTQNSQYNTGLAAQNSQFNAGAANNMSQFNTSSANDAAKYNNNQAYDSAKFNAQAAIGGVNADNLSKMGIYGEQMKGYAAGKQGDAIAGGGKK